MTGISYSVVLLAALFGAFWGWRVGTKRIYRRTIIGDKDDSGRKRRRRKLQRYLIAALYAALCAAIAMLLVSIRVRG